MKYMTIVRAAEGLNPPMELFAAIMQLGEEAAKAGAMVQMGGLLPTAAGSRMRIAKGKLTVTDGPFTETKEVIGGFAIYETETREEAMEWCRRFMQLHLDIWPEFEGEVEIRPMVMG